MTIRTSPYDVATRELDPPLAIVDLDAFDGNAADLVRRAAGTPIRVASKSVRCRALLERVLAEPGFTGVLCYSLAEALWLFEQGVSTDLVVGYPTADRESLRVLAADDAARAAITLMVDSTDQLDLVDAVLGAGHPDVRLCLEFDASWRPVPGVHVGTRRSPVYTPKQAARLASAIERRRGFRLVGAMGYEGQIAGLPDGDPGVAGAVVRWMQRCSGAELAHRRRAVVEAVRGIAELEFVNGGGTGSLEYTRADSSVTELTAGSGLLGPALFSRYRGFHPQPAAQFALPVVRRPGRRTVTLAAGGYVASGQAGASRLPVPHWPPGLRLLTVEGAGEVQTPVTGAAARGLRPGDRVWLRHAKAGELAEHFPHYHLVTGDRIERTVATYRGEGRCFG